MPYIPPWALRRTKCGVILLHVIRRARLGAHHFPEGCLIERSYYEQLIRKARDAREKHEISARLNLEFEYFVKLYECYFEFKSCGGEVDFYALREKAELNFAPVKSFYYE